MRDPLIPTSGAHFMTSALEDSGAWRGSGAYLGARTTGMARMASVALNFGHVLHRSGETRSVNKIPSSE